MSGLVAWSRSEDPRAVVVRLARPCRALSSAPFGGGLRTIDAVVNHAVFHADPGARAATEAPSAHLRGVIRSLGLDPRRTAGLMTAVAPEHLVALRAARGGLAATALATAGVANALRVGDRAGRRRPRPGTINLILVLEAPLEDAALAEAMALAVEARTLAVVESGVPSRVSGAGATGTGTDAVVVAAPIGEPRLPWCGKHTLAGELLGRAALGAMRRAVAGAVASLARGGAAA